MVLDALADIRPRAGEIPLYSTVTGERVDGATLDADYWYRNLRATVEFDSGTRNLLDTGITRFLEMSPHPVLTAAIEDTAEETGRTVTAIGSLRRDDGGRRRLLTSLSAAWCDGASVSWGRVSALGGRPADIDDAARSKPAVPLPTYAFQREGSGCRRRAGTRSRAAVRPRPPTRARPTGSAGSRSPICPVDAFPVIGCCWCRPAVRSIRRSKCVRGRCAAQAHGPSRSLWRPTCWGPIY